MTTLAAPTELDILSEVIEEGAGNLSPEVAAAVLKWRFSRRACVRIAELSERNQRGELSELEREELDRYLRVGSLVNLVQAKARLALQE
jgi:hypothetical protein